MQRGCIIQHYVPNTLVDLTRRGHQGKGKASNDVLVSCLLVVTLFLASCVLSFSTGGEREGGEANDGLVS